jgi:D-serine deaminase-like pyridoxal phosphate-dependent protein
VLIKVDVGFHRCGIDPAGDALGFVQTIASLPGLRLRGLLSHAGHGYHASSEDELAGHRTRRGGHPDGLRDRAARSGVQIDEISVGATPTLRYSAQQPRADGAASRQLRVLRSNAGRPWRRNARDCALTVLATGRLAPAADRIILDCGSKTLTNDLARGIAKAAGLAPCLRDDGKADDTPEHRAAVRGARHRTRHRGARFKPGDRVASCRIIRASSRIWSTWFGCRGRPDRGHDSHRGARPNHVARRTRRNRRSS